MGTNYYVVKNGPSQQEPVHIGKKSYGWLFAFQTQNEIWHDPPVVWNTFDQVKDWLEEYTVKQKAHVIIDEYDEVIPFEEFIQLIQDSQEDEFDRSNEHNFDHARNVNGYRFIDGWFG